MEISIWPDWFIWIAGGWVILIIGFSIVIRKMSDKDIFPTAPDDALFAERGASARMASRCLLVAVTKNALVVTPTFPFNLMFLPQVYGLEHDIPISSIDQIQTKRSWLGSNAIVSYGKGRKLALKLKQPEKFDAVIQKLRHKS